MSIRPSRRTFLKATLASMGAAAATRVFSGPMIRAAAAETPLRVAMIGCGGRGTYTHVPVLARERLVALVDPDQRGLNNALKRVKELDAAADTSKIRTFRDYRELFDKMPKDLDAIFVATPNHHHALPALMAMKLGISCYVEKPMAYDIWEARTMAEYAKKYQVMTQMGNQGHSGEGYRRLCEYIWAGAIGKVTEVHSWTNRANGGAGGRPPTLPVPANLNWENWIGPAPFRDYHADLHPHEWHGWHDFGNGSLGNMGCHILDGAMWALKLGHPTSIEVEEMVEGSAERYPTGTRIRWDYPARGDMPPVAVRWYDGKRPDVTKVEYDKGDAQGSVSRAQTNRPPLAVELEQKYKPLDLGSGGSLYVGDKGIMYTGGEGNGVRIIPEAQHKATPIPTPTIPRIKNSHQGDFLRACRGGEPACANFDYSARLVEMILLGCLAVKAGLKRKVEWDGPNMKCTNLPEINRCIQRTYRKGWEV